VPPWFAEASRLRPQRSTPTQPRNGRRRPGPTPNSTDQRKPAFPSAGLSPAAPECPSEGAQAALQRLPLSGLRSQPRTLSINAIGRCPNVAGRIPRGVRCVKTGFRRMHILISGNARSSGGLGMKRSLRGTAHSVGNVSLLVGIENLWGCWQKITFVMLCLSMQSQRSSRFRVVNRAYGPQL